MKYQIQTATNHEQLTQQVNAQLSDKTANWKPLGGVQIQAIPMQMQTLQGVQMGITVVFAQSLIDYEDKVFGRLTGQNIGFVPDPAKF